MKLLLVAVFSVVALGLANAQTVIATVPRLVSYVEELISIKRVVV